MNSPATVNATLEVGASSETIEVSAEAAALNTTDASLGNAFGENQVRQLPLEGRNVPDLLSLQAGVVYTGNRPDVNTDVDTRSGSVNGARSDQSTVTLDGINVNDSGGHAFTSVLPVTLDSVQEFRVTTTNYNADQGGSSGAQVALVTKSGTNNFHGSLYEYHRNTYTTANDFFVKSAELSSGQPNEPPKLIRNVFGASVGGPIKKDRFYFFANYEGTRRAEANSAVRTVPTASLRDGVIFYQCDSTSSTVATDCPGGSVAGVSGKSYTIPAPVTQSNGSILAYNALSPQQITSMDTQGIGPSTVMLNYFNGYPVPNDTTVGDGFNYSGFRFPAAIHDTKNWYIAKLDYNITRDARHRLSWSGAMANQGNPQEPFLPNSNAPAPGTLPETTFLNYNKGFVVNYSGVLSSRLVNNFRYGYLRESNAFFGDSNQQWILFRGLSQGITRSSNNQRPQNQFSDDLSWSKGKHTFQFGIQTAFIRNPRVTQGPSFSDGVTNASWLDVAGFAGTGATFDPSASGFPGVDGSFANSYDFPLIAMLGMVTEVDATYNYLKDGSVLAQGAAVKRRFAADSYEFYVQDSWKLKPNFTLTYGLRYSLFSPPWETNGLQVSPSYTTASGGTSFDLGAWFKERGKNMLQGVPSNQDPSISFDLSGPANGGKGNWYNWDYHNFGPRLAFAWSPRPHSGLLQSLFGDGDKTSIRGGASIVYDRIGAGLLNTFDSTGSFGLSTTLSNPAGVVSADCAPRLTDLHSIPGSDLCGNQLLLPAPPGKFPQTFPSTLDTGGFAIAWGVDAGIKTPYSYTLDLSVGRQLPKGFAFEVSYVGRLSHRLLAQEDLAMPKDLVDPASKLDYFKAVTALAKIYRTGLDSLSFNSSMVPANVAQYWQNMIQPLAAGDQYRIRRCTPGNAVNFTSDPVVAAYDLFCGFSLNETTALFVLDLLGIRSSSGTHYFPKGGPNSFFNPQYSLLYAWRSATNANYHALQVNFRHPMSHGLQFDFNYTFSKSIDIMSDAERIGAWGGLGGQIINSWDPNAMRAVSDYDAKHQFNANWIAELPFGKAKAIAGNAGGALDAIIGGWQLSGLFRMTSGFPFNVFGGFNWPTNWQLGGNAILVSPVKTGHFTVSSGGDAGSVNAFANGPDAINSFRAPFPGESGARNQVRGDGFFGIDMGLAKRWKMPFSEKQSLQFRWEVFNITNSVRFNVQSNPPELDISTTFGNYTGLVTNPRVMQFALRYEF